MVVTLLHCWLCHNTKSTLQNVFELLRVLTYFSTRVKPDVVTYGHVIHCFAHSKKPKSALRAFEQMRAQHITPNGYTYMGVLRALAHMRDAFSAVQVSLVVHVAAAGLCDRLPSLVGQTHNGCAMNLLTFFFPLYFTCDFCLHCLGDPPDATRRHHSA